MLSVYAGTAPLQADQEADVIAKVAGEVRQLLVEEGDVVQTGQVLARLDGDRLRLDSSTNGSGFAQARARLRAQRRAFSDKGLISAGDFERAQVRDGSAARRHTNWPASNWTTRQIRAPIEGIVSERYIKLGSTLAVDDPVFRVTSLEPLIAHVHVPEREFANIAPGQQAELYIDAFAGKNRSSSSVARVSPVVDAADRHIQGNHRDL